MQPLTDLREFVRHTDVIELCLNFDDRTGELMLTLTLAQDPSGRSKVTLFFQDVSDFRIAEPVSGLLQIMHLEAEKRSGTFCVGDAENGVLSFRCSRMDRIAP